MKKSRLILIIVLVFFLVSGCSKNSGLFAKEVHEHCTRAGSAGEGSTVNLNYEIYYTKDRLNLIESLEEITSNDQSILDTYEKAYKSIHDRYKDIDGYDVSVERTEDTVSIYMEIDYNEVDIKKIIEIEGEEDNIFENGVAKVDKWKKLATQFGTSCSKME